MFIVCILSETEKKGKIKKKTSVQTISYCHRKQLNKLMANLKSTHPHFVRCILPNEAKTAGLLDARLVLHQLHCNNILEGIRITRKGFAIRMGFDEFTLRYGMLKKKKLSKQLSREESKACMEAASDGGNGASGQSVSSQRKAEIIMRTLNIDPELYRIGAARVFFKSHVLGKLEELREQTLARFVSRLQAHLRRFLVRQGFKAKLADKQSLDLVQQSARRYADFKNWPLSKLVERLVSQKQVSGPGQLLLSIDSWLDN